MLVVQRPYYFIAQAGLRGSSPTVRRGFAYLGEQPSLYGRPTPPRPGSSPNPQSLRIASPISNDVLRARAFEHMPRFQESFVKLNQALFGQQRHAGVFAAHLISANLPAGLLIDWPDQVQRSHARFDHQQVRALFRATNTRVDRICSVAHVELVMTSVTELRR